MGFGAWTFDFLGAPRFGGSHIIIHFWAVPVLRDPPGSLGKLDNTV